jgi:hypothetical protein
MSGLKKQRYISCSHLPSAHSGAVLHTVLMPGPQLSKQPLLSRILCGKGLTPVQGLALTTEHPGPEDMSVLTAHPPEHSGPRGAGLSNEEQGR